MQKFDEFFSKITLQVTARSDLRETLVPFGGWNVVFPGEIANASHRLVIASSETDANNVRLIGFQAISQIGSGSKISEGPGSKAKDDDQHKKPKTEYVQRFVRVS